MLSISEERKSGSTSKFAGATTTEPICVASYFRKGVLFGATPEIGLLGCELFIFPFEEGGTGFTGFMFNLILV
jgi:hypothetical protein